MHGIVPKLLVLSGGFLVWFMHFVFVYGFSGLACARGFDAATLYGIGIVPLVVAAATVAAIAAVLFILAALIAGKAPGIRHENIASLRDFWRIVAGGGALLSLVAIVWDALPVLFFSAC